MASDSSTSGIPVKFTLTKQGAACIPPALLEALENADFRIDIPASLMSGAGGVKVSTLPDNLIRLDFDGALYAPATQTVTIAEQTITLSTTTGPGVPVSMVFAAPSVTDLGVSDPRINFTVSPPGANVYYSPPRISGSNIIYDFYRGVGETGPPWSQIIIKGSGFVVIYPAPASS